MNIISITFGAIICVAGGFVWGYRKCKRDYSIK